MNYKIVNVFSAIITPPFHTLVYTSYSLLRFQKVKKGHVNIHK